MIQVCPECGGSGVCSSPTERIAGGRSALEFVAEMLAAHATEFPEAPKQFRANFAETLKGLSEDAARLRTIVG